MDESLTTKALRGLKWTYASTLAIAALQVVYTAIMARLLAPEAFGIVAMAGVMLRFVTYFAQLGVGQAIVQKKELTDEDVRVAFTVSVLLGALFFVFVYAAAPLATHIMPQEALVPILQVLAFSFVLNGLSSISVNLMKRDLKFRELMFIEIIAFTIGYGLFGIGAALSGLGVWSLVIATLSYSLITVFLSYPFAKHGVLPLVRWESLKPLVSFGGRVSTISFFEFIGSSLDTLTIGRLLGSKPLGIYNRAYMLVNLPIYNLTTSMSKVLFPSFSRIQAERDKLQLAYLSAITIVGALITPACVGISMTAREIVPVVLGPNWAQAIPVLSILALATPFAMLSHFGGIICDSTAQLNEKLLLQMAHVTALLILFWFARPYGIVGFACAVLVAEVLRNIAYFFLMKRILDVNGRQMIEAYKPALVAGLLAGFGIYSTGAFFRFWSGNVFVILTAEASCGAALLFLTFLFRPPRSLRNALRRPITSMANEARQDQYFGRLLVWLQNRFA